jgi:signal transduction histidine kinase
VLRVGFLTIPETSKRFMEKFIDVTSHEMRNPLGAIMISGQISEHHDMT